MEDIASCYMLLMNTTAAHSMDQIRKRLQLSRALHFSEMADK